MVGVHPGGHEPVEFGGFDARVRPVPTAQDCDPCRHLYPVLIDFDAAHPGTRWSDQGYAAWHWLDIGNDELAPAFQGRRVAQFFADYGAPAVEDPIGVLISAQLAVCSRCFGVYFGLLAGIVTYPAWRRMDSIDPLPRVWLIAAAVPMAIDWSLTVFGIWENTHLSRFLTGSILGIACIIYIIPAAVEIVRYLRPVPSPERVT